MSTQQAARDFLHPRYWPIWIGYGLMRLCAWLPYRPMMAVGRLFGRLGAHLGSKRRRIVETNLNLCFPECSPRERAELARHHWEAVGMALMDFAVAWWWGDERLYPLVEIQGRHYIEHAAAQGKGVIFLTAHFTSIEISGRLLNDICTALPMYRPSDNPLVEWLMVTHRQQHVGQVIRRNDVRLMIRTLKAGKGVWFAPDQNFRGKGRVFAPFFGIPAASNTSLGRFATMTGAAIVPFVVLRRPGGGYRMLVEPPLQDYPSEDPLADATRYNQIVEAWTRQAPEQYFWLHRRFKKRPEGEPRLYD